MLVLKLTVRGHILGPRIFRMFEKLWLQFYIHVLFWFTEYGKKNPEKTKLRIAFHFMCISSTKSSTHSGYVVCYSYINIVCVEKNNQEEPVRFIVFEILSADTVAITFQMFPG